MNVLHRKMLICLSLLAASFAAAPQSSGGPYEITQSSIDSGGGQSSGGPYELTGTIGQPDATEQAASAGNFDLEGGFWAAGALSMDIIFDDNFE